MNHETEVKREDGVLVQQLIEGVFGKRGQSPIYQTAGRLIEELSEQFIVALATVRREEREAAWLPIETAPKDGTEVLLVWHWDSGIHRGVSVVMASWYCRTHVHLSRSKDCPNEPDCKEGWGAYSGRMSHWMPKPDLPALEASAKKGEMNG